MRVAMLWEKTASGRVHCFLCGHHCKIADGKRGICAVRENRGGTLYTLVYDKVISRNIDPVEKKPLFHFMPGSSSYSIATPGCNFKCAFCQNADISQMPRDIQRILGEPVPPEDIVAGALRYGCKSISYTYTEPTIYFELACDTARLAREAGLRNVFVSNGYITKEALTEIRPYLDAANIDLKSFDEKFYQKVCGAKLEKVLDSIRLYHEFGIWVEITTLIIPGLNDGEDELKKIAGFLASIDVNIPWHVTAFHPTYRLMDRPRTPAATLRKARRIGLDAGLRYVYEGNIPGEGGENTYCHSCGKTIVGRFGFSVEDYNIKDGACGFCGAHIAGVGM
ncbi:MAG: AmmeMemoRadiSam system radical SAM enzyme [Nitrospirae bacterium]|nr:AmmeMemoRadiSam system radical SAM enzyme [Nitrospirota bacterium]